MVYPPLYTAIAFQMTDESVSKNDRGGGTMPVIAMTAAVLNIVIVAS